MLVYLLRERFLPYQFINIKTQIYMLDLFAINETEGKFYISPREKQNSGQGAVNWIVECDTKEDAEAIKNDFIKNNLPIPSSDTKGKFFEKFKNSAMGFDENTSPIYRLK